MSNNIKKIFLLTIALLILVFSCNNHRVFHEVKKFDDLKWHKNDKAVFNFTLEDTTASYQLILNIRYIQGYPYKFLHLNIDITNPAGKTMVHEAKIQIISDEKKYIGDGAGSYWDLDYPVPEYNFHQKGIYKISIEHTMNNEIAYPINEIGISIVKKEKK